MKKLSLNEMENLQGGSSSCVAAGVGFVAACVGAVTGQVWASAAGLITLINNAGDCEDELGW